MALLKNSDIPSSVPAYEDAQDGSVPVNMYTFNNGVETTINVFENKIAGLRLMKWMEDKKLTFTTLGSEGQVSVMSVAWRWLLVYDSYDPYLQRLFQAFTPAIYYGSGNVYWISRSTYEAETLETALRHVGKLIFTDSFGLNVNGDLRLNGIGLVYFDSQYK